MKNAHLSTIRRMVMPIALLFTLILGFGFISSVMTTTVANAAGCGVGTLCGGTENSNTGGGSGSGGGSTKPNPGTGSGNSGSSGSSGSNSGGGTTWTTRVAGSNGCPARQGKAALGVKKAWKRVLTTTSGRDTRPSGSGWSFQGLIGGGGADSTIGNRVALWQKTVQTSKTCLYPSLTVKQNLVCSISFSVQLLKEAPDRKTLVQKTKGTGYTQGSKNYTACKSSSGSVDASAGVREYGYYDVYTWSRAQNAIAEIPTSVNQWTGSYDKPKIISLGSPYSTSKRLAMTASLDCKVGWSNPGVRNSAYWTDEGCEGNATSSYKCVPSSVQVDASLTGQSEKMKSVKTGRTIQFLHDGKPRRVMFSQAIQSKNIKVKSYKTQFLRSGSPWRAGALPTQNVFELSETKTSRSLLSQSGKDTSVFSGKKNTVYATSVEASNPGGGKTTLTQQISWEGTKKLKSGRIVSINPTKGTVKVQSYTTVVPTSGKCQQSIGLQYIRNIQDQFQ